MATLAPTSPRVAATPRDQAASVAGRSSNDISNIVRRAMDAIDAAPEEALPTQPFGDAGAGPSNAPPPTVPPAGGVDEDGFTTVLSKQQERELLRQKKAEMQAELRAQQQRPQQRGGPLPPRANHHQQHRQQRQHQQPQQQRPGGSAPAHARSGARPQDSRPRQERLSRAFPQAYARAGMAAGQGSELAVATPQLTVTIPCTVETVEAVETTINNLSAYMAEAGLCIADETLVAGPRGQPMGLTVSYGMVSRTPHSFESVYNSPVLNTVVDPLTAQLRLPGADVTGATLRFDNLPLRVFKLRLGSPMAEQDVMRMLIAARFLVVSAVPLRPVLSDSERAAMIWQVVVGWSSTDAPGPIKGADDMVVGVFSFPTKLTVKQLWVRRVTGGAWGRAPRASAAQAAGTGAAATPAGAQGEVGVQQPPGIQPDTDMEPAAQDVGGSGVDQGSPFPVQPRIAKPGARKRGGSSLGVHPRPRRATRQQGRLTEAAQAAALAAEEERVQLSDGSAARIDGAVMAAAPATAVATAAAAAALEDAAVAAAEATATGAAVPAPAAETEAPVTAVDAAAAAPMMAGSPQQQLPGEQQSPVLTVPAGGASDTDMSELEDPDLEQRLLAAVEAPPGTATE